MTNSRLSGSPDARSPHPSGNERGARSEGGSGRSMRRRRVVDDRGVEVGQTTRAAEGTAPLVERTRAPATSSGAVVELGFPAFTQLELGPRTELRVAPGAHVVIAHRVECGVSTDRAGGSRTDPAGPGHRTGPRAHEAASGGPTGLAATRTRWRRRRCFGGPPCPSVQRHRCVGSGRCSSAPVSGRPAASGVRFPTPRPGAPTAVRAERTRAWAAPDEVSRAGDAGPGVVPVADAP